MRVFAEFRPRANWGKRQKLGDFFCARPNSHAVKIRKLGSEYPHLSTRNACFAGYDRLLAASAWNMVLCLYSRWDLRGFEARVSGKKFGRGLHWTLSEATRESLGKRVGSKIPAVYRRFILRTLSEATRNSLCNRVGSKGSAGAHFRKVRQHPWHI